MEWESLVISANMIIFISIENIVSMKCFKSKFLTNIELVLIIPVCGISL